MTANVDPLTPLFASKAELSAFAAGLGTKALGREAVFMPRTTSTNNIAAVLAGKNPAMLPAEALRVKVGTLEQKNSAGNRSVALPVYGPVVFTDEQTAGRGRRGRRWSAPPRTALTFSFMVEGELCALRKRGWVALATGKATAEAAAAETGLPVCLKWPNDVVLPVGEGLLGFGKLGGVLCEADGERLVIGIGLNVNQTAAELPPAGEKTVAVGLRERTGRPVDRRALAARLLRRLEKRLNELARPAGTERLRRELETDLFGLWEGRLLHCRLPGEKSETASAPPLVRGRFCGLGESGGLLLAPRRETGGRPGGEGTENTAPGGPLLLTDAEIVAVEISA